MLIYTHIYIYMYILILSSCITRLFVYMIYVWYLPFFFLSTIFIYTAEELRKSWEGDSKRLFGTRICEHSGHFGGWAHAECNWRQWGQLPVTEKVGRILNLSLYQSRQVYGLLKVRLFGEEWVPITNACRSSGTNS